MEKFLDQLREIGVEYALRIVIALIVLIVGLKLASFIGKRIYDRKPVNKIDPSAASFLRSFISLGLKIVVILMCVAILGIPMASVVTVLGTASLAIGLALQGSLSNFAGGFMILVFKPFRVGDYIDNHTDSGTVTEIGIFYTRIETPDKKQITIPNGSLSNATVVNYSMSDTRRVDIPISIAYDSDLDKAKQLLCEIALRHPLVFEDPEPFVAVQEHGSSAIVLAYRVWCRADDYWTVRFDLLESVKKAFDLAGIEIPFQSISVYEKKQ